MSNLNTAFLQVIWTNLYSATSSRDTGTLFAARNITNARNVTAELVGNYYACALMADKFTEAYLVAGALYHFNMAMNSEPTQNVYTGEIGHAENMKKYILEQAKHFVQNNVCIDICPLPDYGPQSNSL